MISWNVNGIRAAIRKGFLEFVEQQNADFICLQETKANQEQVELVLPEYHEYWNSAEKKGYSGTLILCKLPPLDFSFGIGIAEHDTEGRVITLEYPDYYLVTVYTPNAKRGLLRLKYRMEWDLAFFAFLKKLEKKKPVIFCGDLNVAHHEIDLARPGANKRNPGFTDEEREAMHRFVDNGFIDTFREFEQGPDHYTWWSYMNNARENNVGWRIDYFCVSEALRPRLRSAEILPDVYGSDHCPVTLEID
jgi:exodeoxyribonuclease-3